MGNLFIRKKTWTLKLKEKKTELKTSKKTKGGYMGRLIEIILNNGVALTCAISAAVICNKQLPGWGWFLGLGVLCHLMTVAHQSKPGNTVLIPVQHENQGEENGPGK